MPDQSVNLWLRRVNDSIRSRWTDVEGDVHFYDYGFDEYEKEVILLKTEYEHREDVKRLDWEETHRNWTGETWQVDFEPLDSIVQHFLNLRHSVTIEITDLTIYLRDFEPAFLAENLPEDPAPVRSIRSEADDHQAGLDMFEEP